MIETSSCRWLLWAAKKHNYVAPVRLTKQDSFIISETESTRRMLTLLQIWLSLRCSMNLRQFGCMKWTQLLLQKTLIPAAHLRHILHLTCLIWLQILVNSLWFLKITVPYKGIWFFLHLILKSLGWLYTLCVKACNQEKSRCGRDGLRPGWWWGRRHSFLSPL